MSRTRPLRILTWHVHGNYLYYLSQVPHQFLIVTDRERSPGYSGRAGSLPWGQNVREIAVDRVHRSEFDCILYQSRQNWDNDRFELLSDSQRRLPRIYLEHDPPREHPTDSHHPVNDAATMLVHVTHFNRMMWNSGETPTRVVEHGVLLPEGITWEGSLPRGIAVVNQLAQRGRRLGADLFARMRQKAPIDLVGMDSTLSGGLGEIPNLELPAFMAKYRYYCHPVRWTSLGLSVIEAMMVGLPVVGLATTELVTVIKNGHSGFIDTDPDKLIGHMNRLANDPAEAAMLGANAKRDAGERFAIGRFVDDWLKVFREVTE
jgi:glycosyltransferase involved in cell wall biosynthesis